MLARLSLCRGKLQIEGPGPGCMFVYSAAGRRRGERPASPSSIGHVKESQSVRFYPMAQLSCHPDLLQMRMALIGGMFHSIRRSKLRFGVVSILLLSTAANWACKGTTCSRVTTGSADRLDRCNNTNPYFDESEFSIYNHFYPPSFSSLLGIEFQGLQPKSRRGVSRDVIGPPQAS